MEPMERVHMGKICLECETRYRSEEELKEHVKEAHEEEYTLYVVDSRVVWSSQNSQFQAVLSRSHKNEYIS